MPDTATDARRVLIADDDPGVAALLKCWLTKSGYAVSTATDGIEACDAAGMAPPDLILLDIQLPRRDGYAVMMALGSREATAHIPVLFVSGDAGEHDDISQTFGARGFIHKPFTRDQVLNAVRQVFHG